MIEEIEGVIGEIEHRLASLHELDLVQPTVTL